jgi:hypothetical protein
MYLPLWLLLLACIKNKRLLYRSHEWILFLGCCDISISHVSFGLARPVDLNARVRTYHLPIYLAVHPVLINAAVAVNNTLLN